MHRYVGMSSIAQSYHFIVLSLLVLRQCGSTSCTVTALLSGFALNNPVAAMALSSHLCRRQRLYSDWCLAGEAQGYTGEGLKIDHPKSSPKDCKEIQRIGCSITSKGAQWIHMDPHGFSTSFRILKNFEDSLRIFEGFSMVFIIKIH